ncbi:hypothetical protein GCM10010191_89550 [Actinomadura vinacea]|uniref:ComF family protein n=1 Tax=Actinomadura vinacea TaxID=115336 RepID=A0ABN3KCZ8_9ACTN
MPDTRTVCRSCQGTKLARHYLCGDCWAQLPEPARTALNRRDNVAFRRLVDLHTQLREGVPLHEIEVAPWPARPST